MPPPTKTLGFRQLFIRKFTRASRPEQYFVYDIHDVVSLVILIQTNSLSPSLRACQGRTHRHEDEPSSRTLTALAYHLQT